MSFGGEFFAAKLRERVERADRRRSDQNRQARKGFSLLHLKDRKKARNATIRAPKRQIRDYLFGGMIIAFLFPLAIWLYPRWAEKSSYYDRSTPPPYSNISPEEWQQTLGLTNCSSSGETP